MNGVRVNEFPVNQKWVEVEANTYRQVALILLDLNVKVSFRHKSRTFTISAPSQSFGGKMEGLCGEQKIFLKIQKVQLLCVSRQMCERRYAR
jgi:hypothetical protein